MVESTCSVNALYELLNRRAVAGEYAVSPFKVVCVYIYADSKTAGCQEESVFTGLCFYILKEMHFDIIGCLPIQYEYIGCLCEGLYIKE